MRMNTHNLTTEEQDILQDYEKGVSVSVPNVAEEIAYFKEVAKQSSGRTKSINLRLSERDLQRIKTKALQEGVPYQTLIASLIHKYAAQ
jgi:predicted DNA binding CopG/RHH family protein